MRDQLNIIVFGDSISFGQYVSPHRTWVGQMSEYLESLSKTRGASILFQCEAVNGRTTRMALETIPQEVQKHRPDIVLVQFGLNDCNYWDSDEGLPRVSLDAFGANIKEIVTRALHFGANKVFVNTNHATVRFDPITTKPEMCYEDSNELYNIKLREVVKEFASDKVVLVDVNKHLKFKMSESGGTAQDFILPPPDILHLNQAGHDEYFSLLKDYFTDAVEHLIK